MTDSLNTPAALSLAAAARALAQGETTSEALVSAGLARIAAREPALSAWAHIDPEAALTEARERDRETPRGPLHGLPVGIKDIIDTGDMPTAYGSPIYAGYRPPRDAAAVALLRRAGAVILGKTVTTEFAGAYPAPTRNPHAPEHTPGGSSSGSAAAVADFMVPAALGTQTVGSVIRPAAFCGVVGFKPTHGLLSLDGVKPSAPTMDTLGLLVRSAEDVPLLLTALAPGADWQAPAPDAPRFAILRGPHWERTQPEARQALDRTAATFRDAGATIDDIPPPPWLDPLAAHVFTILLYENARNWAYEHDRCRDQLSPVLATYLDRGAAIPLADYLVTLAAATAARDALDQLLSGYDAILTAAVPGEAPHGIASTGDSVFNGVWTLSGLPCCTLPVMRGPQGLPVGIQLVGRRHGDAALAALLRWAESLLAADRAKQ